MPGKAWPSVFTIFSVGSLGRTAVTALFSVMPQTGTSRHGSRRQASSASGCGMGAPPQTKMRNELMSCSARFRTRKGAGEERRRAERECNPLLLDQMHEHRCIPGFLEDQSRAEMERQPHTPFKSRVMANSRGHVENVIRGQLLAADHGLEGRSEGVGRVQNPLWLTCRA